MLKEIPMSSRLITLTLAVVLSGCAGPQRVQPDIGEGLASATVLVYREPAFNSGLVALHFGEGRNVYLALRNGQYGVVQVAAGLRHLTVGATGTKDYHLEVQLAPDTTTCVRAYPDPANVAKVIVPILMNLTNAFKMEIVECPSEEFLAEFERVFS